MGHSHDKVAAFLAQTGGLRIGGRYYILELHSIVVLFGYKTFGIHVKAQKSHLVAVHFLYHGGHENTARRGIGEIVVCRQPVALHVFPIPGQLVNPVVKLMVAENADVVVHHVEQRILHIPLEILEIERSLHHVACIDENHVFLCFSHRVYNGLARQHTARTGDIGIDVGMGVVGGENNEIFCHGGPRREEEAAHHGFQSFIHTESDIQN